MTVKLLQTLTISGILLLTSGCSILPSWGDDEPKIVEKIVTVTKKEKISIKQPNMPRALKLEQPQWYVVSETTIPNPCIRNEEGKRDCSLGKENDWPDGYTYLDRFIDEMKKQNGGDAVFTATTINDYELMARNIQELRRYIRELGEVIIYYRTMTMEESDNETNEDKSGTEGKTGDQ